MLPHPPSQDRLVFLKMKRSSLTIYDGGPPQAATKVQKFLNKLLLQTAINFHSEWDFKIYVFKTNFWNADKCLFHSKFDFQLRTSSYGKTVIHWPCIDVGSYKIFKIF